ncbi:MAG TPA: HlyD family type I secretion periplasmic adaptor subunit [Xanthobacteraceae bacterium]|nr:HlyD family type I secretion periplasmic adaptor subunit [Xanthobacteraceae bacterium]
MATPPTLTPFKDIRTTSLAGISALVLTLGTAGVWATTAPLASAVIAQGQVVVESNARRVQHPTGGVIADIRVNDGDHVHAGDILVRLDDTTTRANLGVIENQLHQLMARKARLVAERDGAASMQVPRELAARTGDPAIDGILAGEKSLLAARRKAVDGQLSQLKERIAQTREEIRGLTAQADSKREQIRLIEHELDGVRELYRNNLIPLSRLTSLEREAARLAGEQGQHMADVARAKGRITEIELQMIQIGQEQRREVTTDLRDVETKIADLLERRTAALDQLQRIDVRAPQDGIVHQKSVYTIGGVIGSGEQMMLIIPEKDGLVVDARVEPQMIDRVKVGQAVTLRFSAFNSATTPELSGSLTRVSADLTRDQQTGVSFYVARVRLDVGELEKLAGKRLVPGMPVEVFIQTGSRTALAYFFKPIEDQLNRAFRYE